MQASIAYPANDLLGEGPVWNIEEQALYWIDILQSKLQKWHPVSGGYQSWQLPEHIGSYAFREYGGAILALRTGFYYFDLQTSELEAIFDPEPDLNNRMNDGACDRMGRFWAGSLSYEERLPVAALYRLDPDMQVMRMRENVTVSNGLGWSPDNKTMYYADSPTQGIYAYDFELETGSITNERVFAKSDRGYPDGLTVDAEGYVWSAKWDGWCIERFAPDGRLDTVVELPVQRPTSCMFGGPDLKQLFITSAQKDLTPEELAKQPAAGHVLMLETAVEGLPEPKFKG